MNGKKKAQTGDVTQVKKNTQTTDSIISQAVTNATNISSMTMSKEEHDRLISARHKMPAHIVALKYFSLVAMAVTIVAGLLLKADLSPRNDYLGILGVDKNTGSKFVTLSQQTNVLTQENENLKADVTSINERSEAFDNSSNNKKVTLLVPELLMIEENQKIWFDTLIEELNEDEQLVEVKKYGLIDSFANMIDYFEDSDYQPRFFNEKNRNQSLSGGGNDLCQRPDSALNTKELNRKRELEASGQCLSNSTLIMANEIEIRGLNINSSGASVTVAASDLLSRVFTLSSEFVAMMNSFEFYSGAEITNFTRRELEEGGDTTEVALRLEFQDPEEEDPFDEYFIDFTEWEASS